MRNDDHITEGSEEIEKPLTKSTVHHRVLTSFDLCGTSLVQQVGTPRAHKLIGQRSLGSRPPRSPRRHVPFELIVRVRT